MLHYKSDKPSRPTALRKAQYAFSKYIEGTEKAYMVEAAIDDIVAAYGMDDLKCVSFARLALQEEDEDLKQAYMAQALCDVLARK